MPNDSAGGAAPGDDPRGGGAQTGGAQTGGAGDGGRDLTADLLLVAPHVAWGAGGVVWLDARGLGARQVAGAARLVAETHGVTGVRAGVGSVAVVAEVAARAQEAGAPLTVVPSGAERRFLAPRPVGVLAPAHPEARDRRLLAALADVGIETCGDLAALTREAVETRLGPAAAALWRLARADDPRRVFGARSRALPSASVAWEEYALRDPERLAFPTNALVEAVCAELRARGEGARQLTLAFTLADGSRVARPLRAARGTADRTAWMRLVRHDLDRFTLPDAVVGLAVRVDAASGVEAPQGDLFDRGFQSAEAAEAALARLVDDGDAVVVGLTTTAHPLVEYRARWEARTTLAALAAPRTAEGAAEGASRRMRGGAPSVVRGAPPKAQDRGRDAGEHHRPTASGILPLPVPAPPVPAPPLPTPPPGGGRAAPGRLSLQLLPTPRPVAVATAARRGARVPVRYRDRAGAAPARPVELLAAAGPDVVSGGSEAGAPYARAYFQCLTSDGALVLLFRDLRLPGGAGARRGAWYLHGWWD